jgi:hypothetical protein
MMKRPDLFGLDGSTNCRKEMVRCFLLIDVPLDQRIRRKVA